MIRDNLNQNPGKRLICEWCGSTLTGKKKRFCSRICQNRYFAYNKTSDQNRKASESGKGLTRGQSTKDKIRKARTGTTMSEEQKIRISNTKTGVPLSTKHKDNIRNSINNYEYDPTKPQPEYRRKAIEAYGYKCELCSKIDGLLVVHHLDGNHSNDKLENLVVLCISCHNKIHCKQCGQSTGVLNEELTSQIINGR